MKTAARPAFCGRLLREKGRFMEELLALLDIDSAEEFEYFENFADLAETAEDVSLEALYALLSGVDMKVFAGLVANYFDDLLENLPDDAVDLYTLLHTIKASLVGLAKNADEENNLVLLSEELARFRNWYVLESKVGCEELGSGEKMKLSVADAIATHRCAKFDKKEYTYDFGNVLGYPLDEYIVSMGDMVDEEYADEIPDEEAYVPDDYWKQREE